ncbi:GbsR/MarR family transcriptional regulator [Galbibacter mesophilus]|uniref:GbsR/MarR family transcriptional regulator n=1 Tax=Galbibacter mesophilus TaxID=379069 RepID=UPI00191FC2D7|nr:MarR family transcriptional regulator [Galbibacter mesophilus]MCM5662075.1 MarR family transcriptional regulator [Galbibacter mesophilus]
MIKELEISNQKSKIIEEMGVYFECQDGMSPLSSRIFALLVLEGSKGATFEEIVEALEISKSSASTNLQLLQSMGRISYYTKPGDRKRYFKASVNSLINRLDDKIEAWKRERCLHERVASYRKNVITLTDLDKKEVEKDLSFNLQYIEFVDVMIQNLGKLKNNILQTVNQE